jgi:hypothetical protein
LSCINIEKDAKNRSNSPLKELQDLIEAEEEFHQIFNKTRKDLRGSFFPKLAGAAHLSPDARTADQSFTNISCSSYNNSKDHFCSS